MNTEFGPTAETSQEDKVMAALAHAGVLLPMTGVIVPIVIWVTQKDKSRFVAFQALQATVFHLLLIVLWFLGMGCYMLTFFGTLSGSLLLAPSQDPGPFFLLSMGVIPVLIFVMLLFLVYGIVGAVTVLMGKDFRYLGIGSWVERYLTRESSGDRGAV